MFHDLYLCCRVSRAVWYFLWLQHLKRLTLSLRLTLPLTGWGWRGQTGANREGGTSKQGGRHQQPLLCFSWVFQPCALGNSSRGMGTHSPAPMGCVTGGFGV